MIMKFFCTVKKTKIGPMCLIIWKNIKSLRGKPALQDERAIASVLIKSHVILQGDNAEELCPLCRVDAESSGHLLLHL